MPFTFSHPFIVLPLCKSKQPVFSATGLITGSMVLDFEYFIYMKKIDHESFHTLPGGVFIFGLPVGLLLTFIYHLMIRNSLIANLPMGLWRRLAPFQQLDWIKYFRTNYIRVIVSLLVGIYSHLLLDAFTHDFGFIVNWFPVFREQVQIAGKAMPMYDVLQAGLSLAGALLIVLAIYTLKPDNNVIRPYSNILNYWIKVAGFFVMTMLLRFLADTRHNAPIDILIAGIASSLIALFLVSLMPAKTILKQEQ